MALTHTETKISDILKKLTPVEIHSHLNNITLTIVQKEDKTKIMILKVPTAVINEVKLVHRKFLSEMKSSYPDYFLYMIRKGDDEIREPEKKKLQEDWVNDLAYPSLLKGRRTNITPGGRMEEAIIERTIYIDEHELSNKAFVFQKLTDREINFILY